MISVSVAHLAVLAPNAQRDALLCAPLLHLANFALVVEDGLPLDAAASNAAGESVEAKETLLTVTRRECITSHVIRSLFTSIPVQCQPVVHQINCKINLELPPALILIQVILPLWFSNIVHGTITNNMEEDMNHTVESPAEQAEIVAVGTKTCGVVSTVSVVAADAIHVLDV